MVEILFVIGLLGWLGGMLFEYLYTLPGFATLMTGFLLVPVVAAIDYASVREQIALRGIGRAREATPPEKFYWPWTRARLLTGCIWYAPLAVAGWLTAFLRPIGVDGVWGLVLAIGAGLVAILSTGRWVSRCLLYFNACQWYDRMTPWFMGYFRRTMYRLSENPEFLGDETFHTKPSGEKIY